MKIILIAIFILAAFEVSAQETNTSDRTDMELIGTAKANKTISLHGNLLQTVSGTIQGRYIEDPKPMIELGVNGKGVRIQFESMAKLKQLGLSGDILAHDASVQATGKLKKGKTQDELDVKTITIKNKTYKIN